MSHLPHGATNNATNMKAPKCRLCGKEHWSNEPHVFGGSEEKADSGADKSQGSERGQVVHKGEYPKTPNRRSREAYNAYQREYMRKRRAKLPNV